MSVIKSIYSKILVGVDGSEDSMKAADHAVAMAKLHNAKLLAVHAIPSQMRLGGYSSKGVTSVSPEYLAREAGIEVETKKTSSGYSAGQVIVDLAEKENIDLVVVGTRGTTGFKKLLLGSTALEVVTYSDCSILVVK